MLIYIVNPGDTVSSIARQYNINAETVQYDNQLEFPYDLAVGQALLLDTDYMPDDLPQAGTAIRSDTGLIPVPITTPKPSLVTNGYAYPFIDRDILDETLPYLTRLSIFSYGFTTEGNLIPPLLDHEPLIRAALYRNSANPSDSDTNTNNTNPASADFTAPFLTLTPFGADGRFNNNLITQVINNPAAVDQLISELEATILDKGYMGVDIDFEYIVAEDRLAFVSFVAQVRAAVNALGYPTTVALAPKTSDDQPGLLYEGKDYRLLGEAADEVLLMTYEWGYTYSEPKAVAPIENVRRVVEYALSRIPAGKINMGIPNYGYDWPLPYRKGVTAATTIGNVEAVRLAIQYNAEIFYDDIAQTPHFNYTAANGTPHEVWFEDVRSMNAKFDLVQEYGLHGVGYWQIMRLFRANWILLANRFSIDFLQR